MPDHAEIWDTSLTPDELAEYENEQSAERAPRRTIGPRQLFFLVSALDAARDRLPDDPMYGIAFEDIVLGIGQEIERENFKTKGKLFSRLDLIERLKAYHDDTEGRAQDRKVDRMRAKQAKYVKMCSKKRG